MMKTYAQILKSDNTVNLIGGTEMGLPVYDHELVYCIDITDREDKDTIEVYMIYDEETDIFAFPPTPEPQPEPTTPTLTEADLLMKELIDNDLLK